MNTQKNLDAFYERLKIEFADLFANDPAYAHVATLHAPAELARKLVLGLDQGTADKNGKATVRTCKHFGIANNYRAIRTFLSAE